MNKNEIESFKWFQKAFMLKQTKATINNYGIYYIKGIGVQQNIEKAKEIFSIGMERGFEECIYHMRFILENFELYEAIELGKEQKDRKCVDYQSKSAIIMNINEFSIKQKCTPESENIEPIEYLAIKYSKENDPENTFIYMNKLI